MSSKPKPDLYFRAHHVISLRPSVNDLVVDVTRLPALDRHNRRHFYGIIGRIHGHKQIALRSLNSFTSRGLLHSLASMLYCEFGQVVDICQQKKAFVCGCGSILRNPKDIQIFLAAFGYDLEV